MMAFNLPSAYSITPSTKQIEQFKKMSPQQQKQIAKQLGYDLGDFQGNSSFEQKFEQSPEFMLPRQEDDSGMDLEELLADIEDKPEELTYFGYDLFAGEPTTFAPVSDIPVPSEYIVGPGDELVVQLYGKQNENYNLTVFRDGQIQFPQLGPIAVSGMAFDKVRELLTKRIKSQILGVDVSISIGELRSMRVLVLGDAYKPGSYQVSSLSTITNALFVSGGVKEIGSLRNIQLKRKGQLIAVLDLYDLLLHGDTSNDLRLQAGDVVFIPSAGARVSVTGEVNRPAIYEISKNETIKDLILMMGGAKADSNQGSVLLNRINSHNVREALDLDINQNADISTLLQNGDELVVGKISDYVEGTIELTGAVTRAGAYHWKKGLKISDVIKNLKLDLLKDADLNYSIISRKVNINNDIEVLQFSLTDALTHLNNPNYNIELNVQDEIFVFSIDDSLLRFEEFREGRFNWKIEDEEEERINERTERIRFQEKYIEREEEEEAEDAQDFSRVTLLKPIIEQLRKQSSLGNPYAIVSIQGEVQFPGTYPLAKNTRIDALVHAAGGLNDSAYTVAAELTRRDVAENNTVSVKHLMVDLNAVFDKENVHNISLKSRDVLTIRIKPEWNEVSKVIVKGEVKFPGTYVIRQGETLKQVINRAGGLTEMAYAKGAIFMRKELQEREEELLKEMQERLKNELAAASLSEADENKNIKDDKASLELVEKLDSTQALGRLVIDLPEILENEEGYISDLLLKDGDELAIPPSTQTISVIGQVQHPTAHIFNGRLDIDKYLELSGGFTNRADKKRVFVIKANGAVKMPEKGSYWFASKQTYLEAGDTVVVPLNTSYIKPLTLWNEVTSIVFQSVVTLASLARL